MQRREIHPFLALLIENHFILYISGKKSTYTIMISVNISKGCIGKQDFKSGCLEVHALSILL